MGIYVGNDPPINSTSPKLVEAVISYGVDLEMKIYRGTYHRFFKPRQVYNEKAARDAWERTKLFLRKELVG